MNDNMARYVARNTIKLMLRNSIDVAKSRVAVLGITFKENCPDIRNSKVVDLISELNSWGINVLVSDPYADPDEVTHEYRLKLTPIEELGSVDALIVAVGHNEYRALTLDKLKNLIKGEKPLLVDVKALYDRELAKNMGFTVFRL
jgi:UDP-N-acetyl-D-galactosamine dehydrogenase